MDYITPELMLLLPLAFSAGLIDSAVGGGGLIQVPGLFSILPQQTPAMLLGTNKLSSICGTAIATHQYSKRIQLNWRMLYGAILATLFFSVAGASAVALLPVQYLRPIMLVLLLIMVIYTLLKKNLGQHPVDLKLSEKQEKTRGLALGVGIGLYDGFFGPGTGSILAFAFVKLFGHDFLKATAHSKVLNLAANVGALGLFGLQHNVLWGTGILMGLSNIAGALCGTHAVGKYGAPFIRKVFIFILSATIIKFTFDTVKLFLA
ncbi:hypothetical protein DTO96_100406 [Ephemeroptericola cinctiostellae]|uniref:Probable membrane transporter protein n=1 Tax=Ephemeroptericola cinctiostellae TaxID=2268024 RepID=A0A345D8K8_9BURK|nr:TSUP family transporter [Ephemeroptericola cinctiostellae]AXF84696.1 hypothetical protein DTO96_100406 [Ephemeroptericola cinctiostellae]